MAHPAKYNKALGDFIAEKVEDGITVRALCTTYKQHYLDLGIQLPEEKQVYRWKKKYPEFKAKLDAAYQTFFYKKIDELEELSTKMVNLDHDCPPSMDYKQATAWKAQKNTELNAIRVRVDTLKFILAKLAPKLCNDLKDELNQINVALPNINIVNYHSEPLLKSLPVTDDPKLIG